MKRAVSHKRAQAMAVTAVETAVSHIRGLASGHVNMAIVYVDPNG
jgi:hypothetical protein